MDFVSGFVIEFAKELFSPIRRRICYMFKFKSNVQKLLEQEEDLKLRKDSVLHTVDNDERQGNTIEAEVHRWLAKVDDFTTRLENITNEENKQCFKGCPNLKTCLIDSKKAVELLKECDRLLAQGNFTRTAHIRVPERTKSSYDKEGYTFNSRESVFEDVMEILKSTDVKKIGVYGIGGVGKSTLVRKVYFQARKDRLFDKVVMADVTRNPDPRQIQADLAYDLGLELHDGSVRGRADRLREHFKKEKSVLVMLDDVWEELDLDVVGIPVEKYAQRDCKLLLTSRDQRLCTDMETQKQIEVRPLHLDEAVELFWGIVNDPTKRPQFESLAIEIVKNCSCLPVAVSAIAKALKNEGSSSWDDALNKVRGMNFRGAEDKVISLIELSYKFLKNEDAQNLFLLCSLHKIGHSISTDDLVRHAIGLNLFQYDNRVKEVRRKVDKLIKDLKDASLLLKDDKEDSVKVHDVIHVVAQKIASRQDKRMFNLHDVDDLEEKLDMGMYKDSKAISLPSVDIPELPQMPELPQLEFLLLRLLCKFGYEDPLEIPNAFFDRMKEMKVLVLTRVNLLSHNPSLGHLRNLQSLCLEYCRLGDMTTVGKLDKLEVLSFSHSNIEKLPEEIGDLARLKLLDLEHCDCLEVIPPNVLSKLTKLEELYMGHTLVRWDAQDNASLNELKQLNRLTILNIHIMDARIIPEDLFLGKLERCVLRICKLRYWFSKSGNSRILSLELENENDLRDGVKKFFKKIEELYLYKLNGFRNVYPQLGGEGFPDLKFLDVVNGPNISHIIRQEEHDSYMAFPMLESLSLRNLTNLERICHGHLRAESFCNLKIIKVEKCDALTHLISSSTAKTFSHLQEIGVADCKVLENIFGKESDEDSVCIELFKLHTIKLRKLPKLMNFGPTASTATREIVPEDDDEDLITLFGRKIILTALDTLELSSVIGMEYLFTMSVASSLVHLRKLKVENCANMKGIVIEVAENDPATDETLFPKLHSLYLECLPKLKMFCSFSGHAIKLASLSKLEIRNCPNMQKFVSNPLSISLTPNLKPEVMNLEENLFADAIPLFDEKVLLPHLKSLTIMKMHKLRRLWHNVLCPTSFCSLEMLYVHFCEKLCNVFPHNMLDRLERLEELSISNCNSLEEIFDVPEGSSSMEENTIKFPKLTQLRLYDLKKLKSFYHGLHISEWPSLKWLSVKRCDKVEILGSEFQILCEEKQSVPQPLFIVDKDAFPRLEKLTLCDNYNLKEIWHGGGIISKMLLFKGERNIKKFPHCFLGTDTLDISFVYFKQIGGGSDNTFAAALRQLRALTVRDCALDESFESSDSLACLVSSWVSFQNLTNLRITTSHSGSRYLLTYSTATSLQHLTRLEISNCRMIEVVIMPPTDEVNDKVVFSQLKYLELKNVESLTSFYLGGHTLEFPSLEKMIVDGCPNMKVFSKGDSITQKLQRIQLQEYHDDEWRWEGDLNRTIQKMFKDMVGFKHINELRLSKFPWLKEVWHDQIPFNSFNCLKCLTVDKCADMSSAVPLNLLPYLKSLSNLSVEDCNSLEEVFHLERLDVDRHFVLLPILFRFYLIELPRLRNIWSKHHLEILGFTVLTNLFVSKCNSLQYIFTTNIILGLKQLRSVKIMDCAMVETIITEDRDKDATMSGIVVPQLRFITLKSLPKLRCFHSGSNVLECSLLKTMTINDCPQMKTFVFTPTEDHDLQDTPLFNEKVAFPNLEELKLSKLPMAEHLWNEPCKAFQYLKTVEISECVNLKSLVPSSASLQSLTTLEVSQCDRLTSLVTLLTAKSLKHLATMNVADCKIMREIITHIHIGDEENDRVVFGQLECIGLHCLPNVTGFYLGDYTIEFPTLEQVVVRQCQKMNTFSKGVVGTPKLKKVQRTEDEEEGRWQNDLNTTIQLLFEETNVDSQKQG